MEPVVEPVLASDNSTKDILIALGIVLVLIGIICAVLFWPTPSPKAPVGASPVTMTSSPVPVTPVTISVLNGSGVVGAAGTVAEKLKSAGFDVTNIGNADRQTYKKTKITSKNPVDPKLLNALGKTETEVDMATGSGDVVEIILGKDL